VRHDALRRALADPLPHPGGGDFAADGAAALAWLADQSAALPDMSVGRQATPAELDALLREPPPEDGQDFAAAFAAFRERVAPYAYHIDHPRFLAFIPAAPVAPAVLGELLCAGCNFFAGVWLEGAGPAAVERIVLDWFRDWLGLPPTAEGVLTGGGSEANLTALAVARHGLSFGERAAAVLYASAQRHASIDRAAMVLGFRPDQIVLVPCDDGLRLSPAALADAVRRDRAVARRPWAVVANGGATNTGAVDSLAALADLCADERLWLHVDAAYGWSAVLVPEGRAALDGIGRADSVTLDPHKWLAQPYDAGCVLVRDGRLLEATFAQQPDYMQDVLADAGEVNFADRGLALTRRFRALKIWLSVKVLGVSWFRRLVERCLRLAEYAEGLIAATPGFRVVVPRQLSVFCFRHEPPGLTDGEALDRHNTAVLEAVNATGRAFLSSTRHGGRVTLRMCFVNWRTTAADVEEVVRLLAEAATSRSAFRACGAARGHET
jgi:glutamate/tyrosine decarboxylase-like PLP-dependent enzyme